MSSAAPALDHTLPQNNSETHQIPTRPPQNRRRHDKPPRNPGPSGADPSAQDDAQAHTPRNDIARKPRDGTRKNVNAGGGSSRANAPKPSGDHSDGAASRAPSSSGGGRANGPQSSRNRNKLKADGNADTPDRRPNDEKQPGPSKPRTNRRGVKFNANLSEPSSGTIPASTSSKLDKKYALPPSKDDDLTTILTRALSAAPYPDCPICFAAIHPAQPSWSCSPSSSLQLSADDTDGGKQAETAQCCWTTFHLKCIRSWATKSVKDIEEAWRTRGEERKGEWRCPGCQTKRETIPRIYWCFCGSIQDPKPPRLSTPHSCASPCSRQRVCGHPCPLACHPGPCPPCMITTHVPCHCGKQSISFLCSRSAPSKNGNTHAPLNLSCGSKCGRKLSCGNHECQDICHDRACAPCQVSEEARCWCGKERKKVACGTGKALDCSVVINGVEDIWVGKYECGNTCNRPFHCGIHKCEKPCHPPSIRPTICPRSPSVITHCPCGKHELADPASAPFFSHGAQLTRTKCTDPIPTCTSLCKKPLSGCSHVCSFPCHLGPCPPCTIPLVRPCRCGSTTREVLCRDAQERRDAEEILCDRPCPALRACGRHQCNRVCCPLAALASATKSKGKKRAANADQVADNIVDEAGWHQCDIVCGKPLACGNHRCEERDHKGPCPSCLRSSFEEMICHCGRTILEPPIPCGTRISCTYPCARPRPPCGHPKTPHVCHEDPTPCPPCPFLTNKPCACGKKSVGNVRCSQEKVSCGTPCGKPLACGFHRCERLCHGDACVACTAVCGKARKLCLPAQHPCTHPCHAPSACPETEPCSSAIIITCPCGRIRQSIQCGKSTSNPAGREATQQVKCTNDCAIAKRNARLAEALGINPDAKNDRQVVYSDELSAFARANAKFLALVEKAFADFVTSDKRTQVLPHMPESRRKFVHDLAALYRMDTQMVDQEPHRSVQLIRRVDTRIPNPLLSSSLPSASGGLGKLADLRAPPSQWPRVQSGTSTPTGSGRGWTSVVAKPATPPPVKPSSGPSSAGTSSMPSRLVPLRPAHPSTSPVPTEQTATEHVPENWEDDT